MAHQLVESKPTASQSKPTEKQVPVETKNIVLNTQRSKNGQNFAGPCHIEEDRAKDDYLHPLVVAEAKEIATGKIWIVKRIKMGLEGEEALDTLEKEAGVLEHLQREARSAKKS